MPSLYSQKDSNIRKTWLIVFVFIAIIFGAGWAFSYYFNDPSILLIAGIFGIVSPVVSFWFSDKIVLSLMRARPVSRDENRELYNVVENLSITAGLPLPKIYIIEEPQLNAFATGRDPAHAVVAVTRGLLERLNRTELEGVLAHELSHIGNRDMLVSTIVAVLAGFVVILADIFWRGQRFRRFGRDREGASGILLLVALVFAILAPIAATLMRLAISRKRESLADASGALLTRYPEGLASALEKIRDDRVPMPIASNSTAHLWIDDPFNGDGAKTSWFHRLFLTHPPVEERIRALREMSI